MALAKVVLPLPLSPAMVVMVAGFSAIVKLKSCKATVFSPDAKKPPLERLCR